MSVPRQEVIELVNGVLADPGFSSKEPVKVAERAIVLWEAVDAAIAAKNAELSAAEAARKKAAEDAAKATKPAGK